MKSIIIIENQECEVLHLYSSGGEKKQPGRINIDRLSRRKLFKISDEYKSDA
jgi:hypothetical protein